MPLNQLLRLRDSLTQTVLGSEQPATLLLTALIAGGHALIEGPPGIGKTALAQALASGFGGHFKRLQCTPDLLPSDILGYHMYRQESSSFDFIQGSIFTNLLLADELNRTSPRVQSALLEAMNEAQVTIDGEAHQLPTPFMVIATQNKHYSTGTFPLPEPQLDRFLLSIPMDTPARDIQERILLDKLGQGIQDTDDTQAPKLSSQEILDLQDHASALPISESLACYIVDLCENVRLLASSPSAVSVRASLAIMRSSQAYALLEGSSHVLPDHVQSVLPHVLSHRIFSENGVNAETIIAQALQQTKVA